MTLRLRPSGAHRWTKCALFPQFAAQLPEQPPGDPAREGTCAAWVAEMVLAGDASSAEDYFGETHTNGWMVDAEMVYHVQKYVDMIEARGGKSTAEEAIHISDNPLISGTADSVTDMIVDGLLYVDDLKYGRSIVEVFENPQLILYTWGRLMKAPPNAVRLVQMSIYQPRGFHGDGIYRKWVVTPQELQAHFQHIWNRAVACNQPDAVATPGPHCKDCPAATRCEALAQTNYVLQHIVHSKTQRTMTPEELSEELKFLDEADAIFKARAKATRAEAEMRIKSEFIPDWKMTSRMGNREFTKPGELLKMITGKDPWERKLCTPAEYGRRGVSDEVLDTVTTQKQIGIKLTRVKRTEVSAAFAQREMK